MAVRRLVAVLGLVTLILAVVAPLAAGAARRSLLPERPPDAVRPLADGMYLRSAESGQVYVIAGGAPLPVTSCSSLGEACQSAAPVSQLEIDDLQRLHPFPRDGTFLRSVESAYIFRVAGGAPLWIASFSITGWRRHINVDQGAIESLPRYPRHGTLLRAAETDALYRFTDDSLVSIGDCGSLPSACRRAVVLPSSSIDRLALLRSRAVTGGTVFGDLLILVLVLLPLVVLVFLSLRNPLFVIAVFLVAFVITTGLRDKLDPVQSAQQAWPGHLSGDVSIYTLDIFAAAFLAVGIYRLVTRRSLSSGLWPIAILLALLAVHILRGIPEHGPEAAMNGGRPSLYFLAALVYGATITVLWKPHAWYVITGAGLILIIIGSYFLVTQGLHTTREMITVDGALVVSRPVVAAGALLALESVILLFGLGGRYSRSLLMVGVAGLVAVFLLQQRTVWIAGAAAGLIVFVPWFIRTGRQARPATIRRAGVWVLGGSALLSVMLLSSSALRANVVDPFHASSTLRWRLDGWRDLIAEHHSFTDVSIGLPAGASLERTVSFLPTAVGAHNFYIDQYLRFGLPGVAVLVALLVIALRGRARIAMGTGLKVSVVALILLVQIVYSGAYSLDAAQGLILGILIAGLASTDALKPRPRPTRAILDPVANGSPSRPTKITAILTSHNRRDKTLACLRSFFEQQIPPRVEVDAVLVDDASGDGTTEAVDALAKPVTVIHGNGDLYWAAGMSIAEERAMERGPDFVFWLNDDVVLDHDALPRMLDVARQRPEPCIVVGALRDPVSGELSYSGVRRHRFHPMRFDRVSPGSVAVVVDTFSGNVVLVSRAVASVIGPIDRAFAHAVADYDYGMRAKGAGIQTLLTPGTVGTCARDGTYAPWLQPSRPVSQRMRLLLNRKGVPPRSRARYLRRHGGPLWPLFWTGPYVRFAFSVLRPGLLKRARR